MNISSRLSKVKKFLYRSCSII